MGIRKHFGTASTLLLIALALVGTVSAAGYGTSSISVSPGAASITPGNSTTAGYTVSLASGGTWGTTLGVANNNQLASQGITVSLSDASGDPPFSGTMSIKAASSAALGNYTIVLQATGDDPSTNNATFQVTLLAPAASTITTTVANSSNVTKSISVMTTLLPTTVAPVTSISTGTQSYYTQTGASAYASYVVIILAIIAAIIGMFLWKSGTTRLAVIGTALIVIGITVWLYGDYSGGAAQYIAAGLIAIIVGALAWLYGDIKGGAYKGGAANTVSLSLVLIIIGIIVWLYGDYYGGGFGAVWAGVVLLAIGVLVWLYGNARAGYFSRRGS